MNLDSLVNALASIPLTIYLVLIANILLIVFAKPLLKRISAHNVNEKIVNLRIALLRGLNLAIITTFVYSHLYQAFGHNTFLLKALCIVAIIYFSYLSNYFLHYFLFRTYGRKRKIGNNTDYVETYQSRALSLLATLLIVIIATVACVHQMGFDSLLEAGGVIGILGVMIGLTQSSWAPDIISGLILLHSDVFEEGDVIELDGGNIGVIYKTKMFHTEILNLVNNHRIMVRNARLRDFTLHNLSKFASAKGLRECLSFKIGYDTPMEKVRKMFALAKDRAVTAGIAFEHQHDVEVKVLETGDHAITWGFIYHVKSVECLVPIRRDIRECILATSITENVSLATPTTHDAILHWPDTSTGQFLPQTPSG